LHDASCADRVGRVGLAVTAAMLTIRTIHFEHRGPLGSEVSGQARPPRPGAFDTDRYDHAVALQPPPQLAIPRRRRRERFGAQHPADLVEGGRDVGVFVGVDTAGHLGSFHRGHRHPFRC